MIRLLGKASLVAAISLFAMSAAFAADAKLTTLKENIFICVSPEAYDTAMGRVQGKAGDELESLKRELLHAKQCMFVDTEMVEDIMAPFAVVLNTNGDKVQVQFILTQRKKVEFLHRLINRLVLVGWTARSNLEPKVIL
jgi:hypothetical protein